MRTLALLFVFGSFLYLIGIQVELETGIPSLLTVGALLALIIWAARVQHRALASMAPQPQRRARRYVQVPATGLRAASKPTGLLPPLATTGTFDVAALPRIEKALATVPASIRKRSGSVFYSGREAFEGYRPLYILGLNPGGDPAAQVGKTVGKHIEEFAARRDRWSAYVNDSWEGLPPGTGGLQPVVLHMLRTLGLDPQLVPASNVVFVRTRDEAALRQEKADLLAACWPVHEQVIAGLGVRTVVCFGKTAGTWVRDRMRATELVADWREQNNRGWTSTSHRAADGRMVVTTTHPGRADWRNPAADPTPLIRQALTLSGA